jgi:DNA-binding beta-propeller fold protein YncE
MRKAAILLFLLPATLVAQSGSAPNPYRLAEWGQLPAGAKWGGVISIQPDRNGNIWVFHRSDPGILKFDASGKVVTSFGAGMFAQAHGMDVDRDGNVWVTDAQTMGNKGQQVFKFSPDGKLLMSLGKAGVAAEGPDTFNGPADVVVAPNGDIFVADGHAQMATGRIVKFSKDGKFVKAWGKNGSGPGEFNVPHSIAMDSRGRIFVADRANNRIQIFDQDGRFLDQWKQFGRPSGVYIDRNDMVYVADSQSNKTTNPGFARGIYIGSARDGKVTAFIPYTDGEDPEKNNNGGAEGIAADAGGSVYVGDVTGMKLRKFVRAK